MALLQQVAVVFSILIAPLLAVTLTSHNYGSKTPYPTTSVDWTKLFRDAQIPQTCKLVHFRLVARHGTRSYGQDNIDKTVASVQKISQSTKPDAGFATTETSQGDGAISLTELNKIKSWANQLGDSKDLLERGREEHAFLARDYYNLLNQAGLIDKSAGFTFESSNVSRAKESGEAFRIQWDKLTSQTNPEPIVVNDERMYFHKQCPAYVSRLLKNDSAEYEMHRSKTTPEANYIVEKINKKRLLLTDNVLTFDDIFAMFETAGFETAAFGTSVFAPLFDDIDEGYLEYSDDLSNYWTATYGDQLIADMSCPLINDIFVTADTAYSASRKGQKTTSGFGFAHLEILMPIYSAFRLFFDPKMAYTATATRYFYNNRKFDTSEVGKFASNAAFLFFDCSDSSPNDQLLLLLVNGRAQSLPLACPFSLPCPVSTVKTSYPLVTGYPNKCDFAKMCSLESKVEPTTRNPKNSAVPLQIKTDAIIFLLISSLFWKLILF